MELQNTVGYLKECHPRCVYQNYSRSKIREAAVKNTTIFVGTIIYQLHVSALIGLLQVGIKRQRKISVISIGMGGRDLVYKYVGFVVESVLQQACVRLVCTSVGLAGLGLEALVAGCHMLAPTQIRPQYPIYL